ncbi:hypothetical protein HFP89_10945 [Wenzhouxiangella sp. XN79A]|uniref:carboxypeptidase regulatory-like domain-containing protein n=1 Tax=Wenzhouxiangella sp. XN79A TaxID=2724193 RepID=UPI00144AABD4|nr:carboxypeptidase regulatory-like domain-containing protein [Wenzhouxiangella sp. XN79A]NKI35677.1 hypothetical protein [Wenzhouxiangella sp. XN79A]
MRARLVFLSAWWLLPVLLAAVPARADITGIVVDDLTGDPVAGARVRVQTTTDAPATTGADGSFALPDPSGPVTVTAVPPYDGARAVNYITGSVSAGPGDDVEIRLTPLPINDRMPYDPGTATDCASCHFDQFVEWNASRHAGAGVNPWVLDLYSGDGTPDGGNGYVFLDDRDPGQTGFCATCHTPLVDAQDPGNVFLNEVTLPGGLDGVNCLACHQMAEVNDNTDALHHLGNTEYRFPDDPSTPLWVWGPLDDVSFSVMRASYQPGFSESKFCASCHQYNNPDTGAPGQTTYDEWLASPFSVPGPDFMACQDCHMPPADEPGPISSLGGQPIRPAEQRRSHAFIGATPDTLADAVTLDLDAWVDGAELAVEARVANVGAGHAFPTGVSIRNAVLVIEATVNGQPLAQVAGPVVPFYGSASGSNTPDDVAGRPGRGFARVLEGRINGTGPVVAPVLFIDAEAVQSDTRILAGEDDVSSYRFSLDGVLVPEAEVTARLFYRRAWRDLAVTKNWTETPSGDPVQTEVRSAARTVDLSGVIGDAVAIPTLGGLAMLLLISLLLAAAWASSPAGRR